MTQEMKNRLRRLYLLGHDSHPGCYSASFSAKTFTEGEEIMNCGGQDQVEWFRANWVKFIGEDEGPVQ